MTSAIILDTSGWLLALGGRKDFTEALESAEVAWVPGLVLAEMDYHLRARREDAWRLLREIRGSPYRLEIPTEPDLARAREIDSKFGELNLGLVDSTIIALAERLGLFRVLSADTDFAVVRCGPRWDRPLELPVIPDPRPRKRRPRRRR